jgi:hemolysin activation/secretion protein
MGTLLPSGFALVTLQASTRLSGGVENAILSADARAYVLTGPWTFVGRLGTMAGWNLDPENQIPLDGENGVRAYRLHAVEGSRRLVGNLEARVLAVPEVLQLVSFGFAAFGDVGWSSGDSDGFWRLADVGVGLRIGITRASKNSLLRMDVARSLHPDPLGRTGWLLSFSSGQAF